MRFSHTLNPVVIRLNEVPVSLPRPNEPEQLSDSSQIYSKPPLLNPDYYQMLFPPSLRVQNDYFFYFFAFMEENEISGKSLLSSSQTLVSCKRVFQAEMNPFLRGKNTPISPSVPGNYFDPKHKHPQFTLSLPSPNYNTVILPHDFAHSIRHIYYLLPWYHTVFIILFLWSTMTRFTQRPPWSCSSSSWSLHYRATEVKNIFLYWWTILFFSPSLFYATALDAQWM